MAEHVLADLGSEVEFTLDGGPCRVGVESTIVDVSRGDPVILRPGGVTKEAIEEALGRAVPVLHASEVRVSGQLASHYAPKAEVVLVRPEDLPSRVAELRTRGFRVETLEHPEAESLYAFLRAADGRGADMVVVVEPPQEGLGLAVGDRLRKAAAPRG